MPAGDGLRGGRYRGRDIPGGDGRQAAWRCRRGLLPGRVADRQVQGDRDKSIAAGATDYVTKPVDTEDLLTVMERWLNTQ